MPRYYGVTRLDMTTGQWRPLRITTDLRAAGPGAIDLGEHATPEAALSTLNVECGDLNAEGDEGQDRESYTDDQDRDCYSTE